ncbi:MAG: hypothetical protein HQK50_15135 [Oligoflexia bacterium]|nr:hypothetical protein [Oligoflexia bacterium]MBF0366907.1 hypothetical protein [Oligoflexia bacterium]
MKKFLALTLLSLIASSEVFADLTPISGIHLRPILREYKCSVITTCPDIPNHTSSQTQEPVGTVKALTKAAALNLCIKSYAEEYLEALASASSFPTCQIRASII